MAEVTLQAQPRGSGRHAVRELRNADRVPAVVYGPGISEPISLNSRELHKALVAAGTGLISLQIAEREPVQVLAREVQHHPYKRYMQHVDFLAVSMTERLRLHVPVQLEGEAPALRRAGTVLIHNMESIEIECLPRDIPQHLVAPMAKLQTVDDELRVSDLVVPPGVEILEEPGQVIISLTMSRTEAEAEAVGAATAEGAQAAEPEVVARGKAKEGEEEGA